ncbi:DUF2156 domain-containing protein [Desulfovibrio sp. OttesenSCG-928-C06]|nr:DUF2156 domain-containing protein [Desulfovibrio sp. OttesenSCG-928-C06]
MFDIDSPDLLTSLALVPEQLCGYVKAVSGMRLRFCKGMAVYLYGDEAVLVGYPHAGALSACVAEACEGGAALPVDTIFNAEVLDAAVREVSAWDGLRKLTVLAPFRPAAAPAYAVSGQLALFDHSNFKDVPPDTGSQLGMGGPSGQDGQPNPGKIGDCYYSLDLPFFRADGEAPGQKLRNMLRRAGRELEIRRESTADGWQNGCSALVDEVLRTRVLPPGTRHIYGQIKSYLDNVPGAVLFTAREKSACAVGGCSCEGAEAPGKLHGFCVGDFSALDTAFYMFAFRAADAVPGTADLLLAALVEEAQKLGHCRVNLGLCINGGIAFFKRKWGARAFLPYLETTWELRPSGKGFFARLFGK